MNPPTRQKLSKNIFIQTSQSNSKLSLQSLKTQSLEHLFKISPLALIEKHNPPQILDQTYISSIDRMRQKYYDPSYILLTNQIEINNESECLKRFYHEFEFQGKINMLGEYYKYHTDLPRNFLLQLREIINSYQQDKRQLQYKKVREKIKQQKEAETKNNGHKDNHQKDLAKHKNLDSKKNILTMNKSKAKKSEKILKNIHLSYVDFEKKPLKSVKKPHPNKHSTSINQQTSIKKNSLSCKHVLSKDSDHERNQIKKKTLLKNAGHREMKNLQSKYSEIINELFRKKRSSSKSSSILHKLENKITNNIDRIGNNSKNLYVSGQNQPQAVQTLKQQNKEECTLQLQNEIKQIQNKKLTRSKSHAAMSLCKSSKLLNTIRNKIPEKVLKPLPFRSNLQTGLVSSRKNSSNKHETAGETLKRQQFSSNQSTKSSKHNLIHKQSKIVKVFEITKKDLLIYQKGESNSEQEKQFHSSKDYEISKSKGKENKENEPFEKKRTNSMKSLKTVQLNSISKKSKEIPRKDNLVNNQLNKATMFNRIIKSKIRG